MCEQRVEVQRQGPQQTKVKRSDDGFCQTERPTLITILASHLHSNSILDTCNLTTLEDHLLQICNWNIAKLIECPKTIFSKTYEDLWA